MKKFFMPFIIASIGFMCLSIYGIFKPDVEYKTTTGIIVRIDEHYDPIDDSINYTPYIDYKVDKTEYKDVEYGAYNSSMKIGDEVKVYYEPTDPTSIQAEGYKKVPYITLAISIVFLIVSIVAAKKF